MLAFFWLFGCGGLAVKTIIRNGISRSSRAGPFHMPTTNLAHGALALIGANIFLEDEKTTT